MRATDGACETLLLCRANERIASRAVIASTSIAFAIAAFLLVRRVTGALLSPLPVPQLVVTATVVVLWAVVVRQLATYTTAFVVAAIVVLFTLALACSYPGGRIADWLVWPAAIIAVGICPLLVRKRDQQMRPLQISPQNPKADGFAESDAEIILQQHTRIRTADGCESIHGTLVAEFAAGERQTTLYVSFCPPFERLPQVEATVADDLEATTKLSQVLHNGAQFDVRLSEVAEERTHVTVEFFATEADAA